jgi:hypothetical protein
MNTTVAMTVNILSTISEERDDLIVVAISSLQKVGSGSMNLLN